VGSETFNLHFISLVFTAEWMFLGLAVATQCTHLNTTGLGCSAHLKPILPSV
jgi:hypothetical protein